MANKTQRVQKNSKKNKGEFKKVKVLTPYQQAREAAKNVKHRKHPKVSAAEVN